jgi:tetratricopeptide (TPR) repeat protein
MNGRNDRNGGGPARPRPVVGPTRDSPGGTFMAGKGKKQTAGPDLPRTGLAALAEQSQIDFEIEFFSAIVKSYPEFVDVLRVLGNNLTLKGCIREGLEVDRQLVRLRPNDYLAHYNLACSYALLRRNEQALQALRRAVELGYRDFRYMRQDRDLDGIRNDPRFKQLLREYEGRCPSQ